jgi:ketosteroid isomerase-like protein
MSRENLEIAVRAMEAASAPTPDIATLNELYAPDHVLVPVGAGGIEAEGHGLKGFQTWRRETSEALAPQFKLDGAVDIGPSVVLTAWTIQLQGASSGVELEERLWVLVRFKGDKIVRSEAYASPGEALEAVEQSD